MSRPRKNECDIRRVQVNIRLTEDESARINEVAATSGLSPANWIRYKVFTGRNPPARLSSLDTSVIKELGRIGVNLNQAARKLNQGGFPEDLRATQLELLRLLKGITKTLLYDSQHDQG